MELHTWESKHIHVAIVRTDGQIPRFFDHLSFFILDIGRELDVFKPCLHRTLLGYDHSPATRLIDSESATAEADGTKTAVRRDINASCLCSEGNFLGLWIWRKWLSICVSIEIHDMNLTSSFGTPHSKSSIITSCHELVCTLDCAQAPYFVSVPQLWCIVTMNSYFWFTILSSSQINWDFINLTAKCSYNKFCLRMVKIDCSWLST